MKDRDDAPFDHDVSRIKMAAATATPAPAAATVGPVVLAVSGAAALALAMGVGRFAYTALLPSVQRGIGFDDAAAGAVASLNLVGYLAGVLWARSAVAGRRRPALLRLGLAASVLTTVAVAGATGLAAWIGLRFVSGMASGLVFVLVSAAVLEALPVGREHLAGVLYSGVGCGIALSGAVAAGATGVAWPVPWLLLGAVSAVLAVPAWSQARPPVRTSGAKPTSAAGGGVSLGRLGAAYFLEGLGYIVSGTFAVAAVQRRPDLAAWAPWVWVAAGLAAAPSAVLWSALARRVGPRKALVAAFGAQAIGMSLPVLSASAWAAMAGALLFGGTFMGITTLTMSLGRALHRGGEGRVIGTLTVIYGIGQALGPFLAGVLSRATGGPGAAVLAASAAVGVGGALLANPPRPKRYTAAVNEEE
jgi:MFS family permease